MSIYNINICDDSGCAKTTIDSNVVMNPKFEVNPNSIKDISELTVLQQNSIYNLIRSNMYDSNGKEIMNISDASKLPNVTKLSYQYKLNNYLTAYSMTTDYINAKKENAFTGRIYDSIFNKFFGTVKITISDRLLNKLPGCPSVVDGTGVFAYCINTLQPDYVKKYENYLLSIITHQGKLQKHINKINKALSNDFAKYETKRPMLLPCLPAQYFLQ